MPFAGVKIFQSGPGHMKIWRMHIACWLPRATDAHSSCVILNCFPTTAMVARMHLSVMLYVHCLSCCT